MGLLYVNAKCTITATASKDSKDGYLFLKVVYFNDCVLRIEVRLSLVARS